MWFKHRAWIPVAWALSLANMVFVWVAVRPGEPPWHATAHALLAVLFALGAQRLGQRAGHQSLDADLVDEVRELEARLAELNRLPSAEGRLPELEERLDFLERALVEVRNRAHTPPKGSARK